MKPEDIERVVNQLPKDFLEIYTNLMEQGCSHEVANQAALEIMQRRAKVKLQKAG